MVKKTNDQADKINLAQIDDESVIIKEETKAENFEQYQQEEEVNLSGIKKEITEIDWDRMGKHDIEYCPEEKKRLESIYEKTLSQITENELLEGTVVAITKKEVVVNVGYKSEGVISINEFRYKPDLKVGDKVEVIVESQEDANGQLVLSHKKARALKAWKRINEAYEKNETVIGYIKCRTKGGMIVDLWGIETFLPGSQIDIKPIKDYDVFVGKTMEFKVVKINPEFKNVVVSHKAIIEEEIEAQKKDIFAKLEKGQILKGEIKNITSYGAFVDLGGIDGLIHITDLSWSRINHPEEVVSIGQEVDVVILDFDHEKKRISLGLKQLQKHPWETLDPELKVGSKVKGKVTVLADYGAFVEIIPGVEGLIHVTEMSWSQHLRSAQDFLKIGDEVEAVITAINREERKLSLSIKQLQPDPWINIEKKYPVKSKHKGIVRNFTNFGVFVELEEGIDGLIHISDLSWTKKIKHPSEYCKIGDEIDVIILDIDKENRRLTLGHKQLEENPWDVFETIFKVDSIHEGTVMSIGDKYAVILLPYGVEAVATLKNIVKEDGTRLKVDEKANFKIVEFSKENKRIVVSHSKVYQDAKKQEIEEKKKQQKRIKKADTVKSDKTTLGDFMDITGIKEQLIKKENDEKKKSN
ncbi:MAG: 30S ribosomal protein S1 [Bacteroidales bacterium]|nr:30S ribosomal protein S1 [Bacteroidales bacterium]